VPGPGAIERVAVPPGVETEQVQRDRGEGVFEVCLGQAAVAGRYSALTGPDPRAVLALMSTCRLGVFGQLTQRWLSQANRVWWGSSPSR
jgi:hypothetical protein